jgi:hypothetical protein
MISRGSDDEEMRKMPARTASGEKTWKLPPLILHPFADSSGPSTLVESSRASLMLQGLLPCVDLDREDLERKLMAGRYCELRMLFYVGKDLARWIDQCLEVADHDEDLRRLGIKFQSLAAFLVNNPPEGVKEKLRKWGVADYKAIFSRAIGINSVFAELPERPSLADDFVRSYYRYADQLFATRQNLTAFTELNSNQFDFELYASGEYSRMLEREWEET